MKLKIACQQCFYAGAEVDKDKKVPYVPSYPYWEYPTIELEHWPYLEFTCKNGHKQRHFITVELYELLFEQATYCIMDGYYREAIGTYHAALERFFEYAIEIICQKTQTADFENLWKSISRQSERQLGAYYALWTVAFKEMPERLNEEKVKIRNSVIHKGELVAKETALSYGEYVFNYIKNATKKLEKEFGESLHILRTLRIVRICQQDLNKDAQDPIIIKKDGEEFYQSTGSFYFSCLMNNPKVNEYKDCFELQLNEDYGLVK